VTLSDLVKYSMNEASRGLSATADRLVNLYIWYSPFCYNTMFKTNNKVSFALHIQLWSDRVSVSGWKWWKVGVWAGEEVRKQALMSINWQAWKTEIYAQSNWCHWHCNNDNRRSASHCTYKIRYDQFTSILLYWTPLGRL